MQTPNRTRFAAVERKQNDYLGASTHRTLCENGVGCWTGIVCIFDLCVQKLNKQNTHKKIQRKTETNTINTGWKKVSQRKCTQNVLVITRKTNERNLPVPFFVWSSGWVWRVEGWAELRGVVDLGVWGVVGCNGGGRWWSIRICNGNTHTDTAQQQDDIDVGGGEAQTHTTRHAYIKNKEDT